MRVPGVGVYVHRVHARAAVDSVARWSGGGNAVTSPGRSKKKREKVWTPQLCDSNIPAQFGLQAYDVLDRVKDIIATFIRSMGFIEYFVCTQT